MGWESKVIERNALYQEVWAQPMTILAKQYGISDVALRKVCLKLNVPMPQAGHWAKVRHGKRVAKPALPAHKGYLQHDIRRWVDPDAPQLEARLQALVVEVPKASLVVAPPVSLDECHKVVRNTDAALEKGRLDDIGRLLSAGRGCCDVRVTSGARPRAVLLCEQLIRACVAVGMKLEERLSTGDGPRLQAGDRWYTWRVTETGTAGVSGSVAQETRTTSAGRRRPPPGLRIDFSEDAGKRTVLTFRDNAHGRLEAKVNEMPAGLLHAAAVAKLQAELAEEQRRAQEARWLDRQRRIATKKEELERLKVTEELADRLRRAEALRAYGKALEERRFENRALDEQTLERRLHWIQQAADWLDPTRPGHWPEVDDAPQTPW